MVCSLVTSTASHSARRLWDLAQAHGHLHFVSTTRRLHQTPTRQEEHMNAAFRCNHLIEAPCEWEIEHLSHLSLHTIDFLNSGKSPLCICSAISRFSYWLIKIFSFGFFFFRLYDSLDSLLVSITRTVPFILSGSKRICSLHISAGHSFDAYPTLDLIFDQQDTNIDSTFPALIWGNSDVIFFSFCLVFDINNW